jgi:murein DD-endopeptidase MepM/ murein hydrolase activator NlpD
MVRTVAVRILIACAALLVVGKLTDTGVSAGDHEPTLMTPRPTHWLPNTAATNKCRYFRGAKWKMCDGPRRAPEPYGEAAFVATDLGLGTKQAAQHLLGKPAKPEWVQAVAGEARPTLLWPVEHGHFGRGFGYVRKERRSLRHNGVDIGAAVGEPVRAVNDAIVAYSDNGVSGFGNMVMLLHKDGSISTYCHQRANYVFAGQQVRRGQVIGEVGVTGITRGPHLHFEWHVQGRAKDPMPRMVGRPTRHAPVEIEDLWL